MAAAARETYADALYAAQIARIAAAASADQTDGVAQVATSQRQRVPSDRSLAPSIDRALVADRVQRWLGELADVDHDADRVRILIGDIAKAGAQSRIDLLISELDSMVQEGRAAREHAAIVAEVRADLEAALARISDIERDPVETLRQRISDLIAAEAKALPADLIVAVEQLVADDDAEADQRHVISSLRRAFDQLGYTVGPEFETQLESARGAAVISGPTAGYGVKVRLEDGNNRFSAQAVKSDAVVTSTEQDVEVERAFCDDFRDVVELVRTDGVTLDIDIDVEPGATVVQEVAAAQVAASGRAGTRRARRPAAQERQQP